MPKLKQKRKRAKRTRVTQTEKAGSYSMKEARHVLEASPKLHVIGIQLLMRL
jgi:ribosomal protein L35